MPDILARPPRQPNPLISITLRRSTAIGIGVSLLVHLLALLITFTQRPINQGSEGMPTAVVAHLRPRQAPQAGAPQAAATVAPEAVPAAPSRPPPPEPVRRPRDAVRPPVVARRDPTARSVPSAPPPPATPLPPPRPIDRDPETDMMANVEARRAMHQFDDTVASSDPPGGGLTEEQRRDAVIAQNLSQKKPGISGIFRITYMGQRRGSFEFLGWTTNQRLAKSRTFDVDAEMGGSVEVAIVRRMIALIRDYYKGDFNFESQRLNRVIKLSARPEDNAFLENFLLREFFPTR